MDTARHYSSASASAVLNSKYYEQASALAHTVMTQYRHCQNWSVSVCQPAQQYMLNLLPSLVEKQENDQDSIWTRALGSLSICALPFVRPLWNWSASQRLIKEGRQASETLEQDRVKRLSDKRNATNIFIPENQLEETLNTGFYQDEKRNKEISAKYNAYDNRIQALKKQLEGGYTRFKKVKRLAWYGLCLAPMVLTPQIGLLGALGVTGVALYSNSRKWNNIDKYKGDLLEQLRIVRKGYHNVKRNTEAVGAYYNAPLVGGRYQSTGGEGGVKSRRQEP